MFLGLLIGCTLRSLRWTQGKLREEAGHRATQLDAAVVEGRGEVVEDIKDAAESLTGRKV